MVKGSEYYQNNLISKQQIIPYLRSLIHYNRFMGLLRTLLILAIIYYSFKVLARYIFPLFLKSFVKKAQENFERQQGYVDPDEAKKREGEVNIKTNTQSQPSNESSKKELGDYVEFEEIKEEK